MRIGLFGGSFDPPHNGHLMVAQAIQESLNLDSLIFIPAFKAPHKTELKQTDSIHRDRMIKLAIEGNPSFSVDGYEMEKEGVSFTIDTVKEFKNRYPEAEHNLFFIIGSDSLQEFHTWKDPFEILKNCHIVIAGRPYYSSVDVDPLIMSKVLVTDIPQVEISSKRIRNRIKLGLSVKYMMPDGVLKYINENGLY